MSSINSRLKAKPMFGSSTSQARPASLSIKKLSVSSRPGSLFKPSLPGKTSAKNKENSLVPKVSISGLTAAFAPKTLPQQREKSPSVSSLHIGSNPISQVVDRLSTKEQVLPKSAEGFRSPKKKKKVIEELNVCQTDIDIELKRSQFEKTKAQNELKSTEKSNEELEEVYQSLLKDNASVKANIKTLLGVVMGLQSELEGILSSNNSKLNELANLQEKSKE